MIAHVAVILLRLGGHHHRGGVLPGARHRLAIEDKIITGKGLDRRLDPW